MASRGIGRTRAAVPRLAAMAKASPLRLWSAAAIALTFAAGCRQAPPSPPQVLQRIGVEGGQATEPPQSFNPLKLEGTILSGVRVSAESRFTIPLAPGAGGVAFATALSAAGEGRAEVEFRIVRERGGEKQVVYRETIAGGERALWVQRSIALEPAATGSDERLAFETERGEGSRRRFVRPYWGAIDVFGAAPAAGVGARPSPFENVILISLDTLSANYLAGFGEDRGLAPTLEAFRRRGFSFLRAYSNYPSTRPSHATMMSGVYPRRHRNYAEPGPLHASTLADSFSSAAFETVSRTEDYFVGSSYGFGRGFDAYGDGTNPFTGDAATTLPAAAAWLKQIAAHPRRFFLFVHTYEVHSPYIARDEATRALVDRLDPGYQGPHPYEYEAEAFLQPHNRAIAPMSEAELRRMRALYMGEIHYLDGLLASLLEYISRLPFAERTLIVITADHGDEFSEHGFLGHGETLYDPVLHVPLIFYGPGIPAGSSEQDVQLADVAPTILDLLGLPPANDVDGVSLRPLIEGEKAPARPVFAELQAVSDECVRSGLPANCDSQRRAVRLDGLKLISSTQPRYDRLYDLRRDPGETTDLAAERPADVARLAALIATYDAAPPVQDSPSGPVQPLDRETKERLRALGYGD